jgi:hypothetical protein
MKRCLFLMLALGINIPATWGETGSIAIAIGDTAINAMLDNSDMSNKSLNY